MENNELRVMFVVASRPNFMKIAPLVHESQKQKIRFSIFYTEQHKSEMMSDVFFKELKIPKPNFNLGLSSKVKKASKFRKAIAFLTSARYARNILKKAHPDLVIVVGDVISSAYMALIAKSLRIPVAHVEAGLRSFNNKMPEEKSRKLIDRNSKLLFTTEKSANENLKIEKNKGKVFFVGNIMIDSLIENLKQARKINYYEKLKLEKKKYAVLTFHRHENLAKRQRVESILNSLNRITKQIKVVLPLHPNTRNKLIEFGLIKRLESIKNLEIIKPLGYKDMLSLILDSKFVMTDSGGLQEETTYLKIPCLTLRTETERPITVTIGTNSIVKFNIRKIEKKVDKILKNKYKDGEIPKLWDGKTACRIMNIIRKEYETKDNSKG